MLKWNSLYQQEGIKYEHAILKSLCRAQLSYKTKSEMNSWIVTLFLFGTTKREHVGTQLCRYHSPSGVPDCLCDRESSQLPSARKLDFGTFPGWRGVQTLAVSCSDGHRVPDPLQYLSPHWATILCKRWWGHLHFVLFQDPSSRKWRGKMEKLRRGTLNMVQ